MSKKTNSLLFILIASVVNIAIAVLCLFLLLLLYSRFIAPLLPAEYAALGIPVIFISTFVISFFIYRAGMNMFSKKVDIEKNFDPLFGKKNKNES
jgi:hypothetical protein